MRPINATPPATESPMMVDDEMPEPPLEAGLPVDEDCEEVVEEDGESEMTTTLVTTWPPLSVVTTAEVIVDVGVALEAALAGVVEDAAGCEVCCCEVVCCCDIGVEEDWASRP